MTTNTITALRAIFTHQEFYPENLSDRQVIALQNIAEFVNWLEDPRPEFAYPVPEGGDKFPWLIELARHKPDLFRFFNAHLGVSTDTKRRWASGESKPAALAGIYIVEDLKPLLAQSLIDEAAEAGLHAYAHHAGAFYEGILPGSFLPPGHDW